MRHQISLKPSTEYPVYISKYYSDDQKDWAEVFTDGEAYWVNCHTNLGMADFPHAAMEILEGPYYCLNTAEDVAEDWIMETVE